jgi:hypothetical protein
MPERPFSEPTVIPYYARASDMGRTVQGDIHER